MKLKLFLAIVIAISFTSCSYRITRTYPKPDCKNVILDCSPKVVIQKKILGTGYRYIGRIKLDDTGFTINCSKEKTIKKLQEEACILNANLVNVVEYIEPGYSTCWRCIADFYSVDDLSKLDDEFITSVVDPIYYEKDPKLSWSDLKRNIPETANDAYLIDYNLVLRRDINIWWGNVKSFEVQGVLNKNGSGVKESLKTPAILAHLQLIYDLSQIYAKRLELFLNENVKKSSNNEELQQYMDKYMEDLNSEVGSYITETQNGSKAEIQNKWNKKVAAAKVELGIN